MSLRSILERGCVVPLAALLSFVSTDVSAQPNRDLVLTNAHVVDVRAGVVLPERTLLIADGRITVVGEAGDVAVPAGVTVINASGGYVIPGLLDMHAHLRANGIPPWVTTDWLMPLILANGVTGVRDMTSDCDGPSEGPVCLPQMVEWQREIESGARLGPRILAMSSFQISPPWNYVVTEDQARGVVQALAASGVPNLKIYDRLGSEALAWIVDEASKQGMGVWGHVPLRMSAREASRAGLRSIEHARDFLFDCFPGAEEFRASTTSSSAPVGMMRRMVDEHDEEACVVAFTELAANGTRYVPTHVTRRRDAFAGDSVFRADPRVRFVPPVFQTEFVAHLDRIVAADSAAGGDTYRDFYLKGLEITGAAHRAGVTILVGSDAPDSFVFPGSGVHDEMGELVAAGLTPAEALRAATWSGAEFLGIEETYGSVEVGRAADIVILGANPLDAIGNTREIRAVVLGGRYLDREALDGLLESARVAATRPLNLGN